LKLKYKEIEKEKFLIRWFYRYVYPPLAFVLTLEGLVKIIHNTLSIGRINVSFIEVSPLLDGPSTDRSTKMRGNIR